MHLINNLILLLFYWYKSFVSCLLLLLLLFTQQLLTSHGKWCVFPKNGSSRKLTLENGKGITEKKDRLTITFKDEHARNGDTIEKTKTKPIVKVKKNKNWHSL